MAAKLEAGVVGTRTRVWFVDSDAGKITMYCAKQISRLEENIATGTWYTAVVLQTGFVVRSFDIIVSGHFWATSSKKVAVNVGCALTTPGASSRQRASFHGCSDALERAHDLT